MTRDEAIKILEPIMFLDSEKDEALHVAIEALKNECMNVQCADMRGGNNDGR